MIYPEQANPPEAQNEPCARWAASPRAPTPYPRPSPLPTPLPLPTPPHPPPARARRGQGGDLGQRAGGRAGGRGRAGTASPGWKELALPVTWYAACGEAGAPLAPPPGTHADAQTHARGRSRTHARSLASWGARVCTPRAHLCCVSHSPGLPSHCATRRRLVVSWGEEFVWLVSRRVFLYIYVYAAVCLCMSRERIEVTSFSP